MNELPGPKPAPRPIGSGLSEGEAARRLDARGKPSRQRSSRSYASIIRANTLNIPNGILFFFGVLTIAFASWRDALFLGILVANVVIGSFQEIRSKRALDRLAALVARGRRRLALVGLCAAMLALFALALVIPLLREFYELSTPTGQCVAAWAIGTTLGVGGMVGALHLLRV
jgi:hypothetical protein